MACAGPQAFATCAATVVGLTLAAGGSIKQALLAGLMTFAQMGVYDFVGGIVRGVADAAGRFVTKVAMHAVVGGAFAVAQGGEFAAGAMSGAVSAAASFTTTELGLGGPNASLESKFAGTAIAAAAGGTASVLAGGKFANGAVTGAMGHIYNELSALQYAKAGVEVGIGLAPGVGEAQDLYVLGHPGYSAGEKLLAGASLVLNVFTGGLAPNAGSFIRAANHLCSFDGRTKVETRQGRKAIKDVEPGDEVLARDDKTGRIADKVVKARFVNRDGNITRLSVRDRESGEAQTILTTSNHPFFVETASIPELRLVAGGSGPVSGTLRTGNWRDAGTLLPGDRLINADGSESVVQLAVVEEEAQDAYNLEVDGFHTFFVAAHDNDNAPAVWVHNACPPLSSTNYKVISVDSRGNAIPLKDGEYLTGSPDGRFIQVRDRNGDPTGMRIDGPHKASSHPDPRAQVPHAHVPGRTNPDGTPWLPIRR